MQETQLPKNEAEILFAQGIKASLKGHGGLKLLDSEVFSQMPLIYNMDLFVGRKDDSKELARIIGLCLRGLCKKVFLTGDKGIGKTSLISIASDNPFWNEGDYFPISVNKLDFEGQSLEGFQIKLIKRLIDSIGYHLSNREDREKNAALRNKIRELYRDLTFGQVKTMIDLAAKLSELGIALGEDECYFRAVYKKLLSIFEGKALVFFIDDLNHLINNPELFSYLSKIIKEKDFVSIYCCTNPLYKTLSEQNSELIKDGIVVELNPLTIVDCKELLRRRILVSEELEDKVTSKPNYSIDLIPFEENAVEHLAIVSRGNPLAFIKLCREAYYLADEQKRLKINLEIASLATEKLKDTIQQGIPYLPTKKKQLLDFILSRKEVDYDQIHSELGMERTQAVSYVNSLSILGLVTKRRAGKKIFIAYNPTKK